jgi:hypothetical protein
MLNKDFKEFVELLGSTGVEYLVVAGTRSPRMDIRATPVTWTSGSGRLPQTLIDCFKRFPASVSAASD